MDSKIEEEDISSKGKCFSKNMTGLKEEKEMGKSARKKGGKKSWLKGKHIGNIVQEILQ